MMVALSFMTSRIPRRIHLRHVAQHRAEQGCVYVCVSVDGFTSLWVLLLLS